MVASAEALEKTAIVVDSEEIVRKALVTLLNNHGFVKVVADSGAFSDALSKVSNHKPTLLITECCLKDGCGVELAKEATAKCPHLKTIIITHHDNPDFLNKAIAHGVSAYFLKDGTIEEFFNCLVRVSKEELKNSTYLSKEAKHLSDSLEKKKKPSNNLLKELSKREQEIFYLLAEGLQNNSIAKQLYISPRTVETHRARIVRKLGIKSNGELIRFAIKHGLTSI